MSDTPEYGQATGALTRAATLVRDAKADFTTISAQLSDQISAVRGQWGGEGASAFFVLHEAWTEKQRTIVGALDEFAASLTSTERDNTETDHAQGAHFSKLQHRLR